MEEIRLSTLICAQRERVFDLSRSIEAHLASAAETGERTISDVATGLVELNDEVIWEAKHFGLRLKLSVRITQFERPRFFQDIMVSGNFKSMVHDHNFVEDGGRTVMQDCFRFSSPSGIVGKTFDKIFLKAYLRHFLFRRNELLKRMAEGTDWMKYVGQPSSPARENKIERW